MRNKGKIKWIKKRERREEGKEDRIKYLMWIVEDIFLLNAYHYYLMIVTQTSSFNIWIYSCDYIWIHTHIFISIFRTLYISYHKQLRGKVMNYRLFRFSSFLMNPPIWKEKEREKG